MAEREDQIEPVEDASGPIGFAYVVLAIGGPCGTLALFGGEFVIGFVVLAITGALFAGFWFSEPSSIPDEDIRAQAEMNERCQEDTDSFLYDMTYSEGYADVPGNVHFKTLSDKHDD